MQVIILEDLDFAWEYEVMQQVKKMWELGVNIITISKNVKRTDEEVFLLLLHLAKAGNINKRKNAIWGSLKENLH